MSDVLYYQEEDVMPYMKNMWQDLLMSVCGVDRSVFSGKHQPCPNCGGVDRFRWTNKRNNETGDGWAYCNSCGADKGIGWLMRLSGEPYSECVNICGRFLGKVPQEYVIKQNKRASRDPGYNFGSSADPDKCQAVIERTEMRPVTNLTRTEGFMGESYRVGVKSLENGAEKLTHVEPCYLVSADGPADEPCNILFIDSDSGAQKFYAQNMTFGSVTVTNQTDKSIYLVTDWIAAQHAALAMTKYKMNDDGELEIVSNQEVWNCFNAANLEIVAHRYKGSREMRVICNPGDRESLYMADERQLKVLIPKPGGIKSGLEMKLYDASELIENL